MSSFPGIKLEQSKSSPQGVFSYSILIQDKNSITFNNELH